MAEFGPIISARALAQRLDGSHPAVPVVVDCRFDLSRPEAGRLMYRERHIPGARYAHLDDDLSAPRGAHGGRHPLPSPEALEALFSRLGISKDRDVVCYDQKTGAFAARLWWMLRYMGHAAVAVLDGGFAAWLELGQPVEAGEQPGERAVFSGAPRTEWLASADEAAAAALLVDAREPARYRGEVEPLDPVAGHIPGAVNRHFQANLTPDGRWLSRADLARELRALMRGHRSGDCVFYCGSGVTACHDLLALELAGLPPARLYAGSWSDWCSVPSRPVARGDAPAS